MKLQERVDTADLEALRGFHPDEMLEDLDQIADEPVVSLRDLYARWERQSWSAYKLDFAQDAQDWTTLGTDITERLLWVMTMFFHGEEAVTASLANWVAAAPTPEIQIFLSTQLADEARHTVFFDRFFAEAVGVPGDLRAKLDWCHPRLNKGYDDLFWGLLPQVGAEVAAKPRDPVTFARGVALYHIFLEGALALAGQRYILAFCRERGVLPAFRSGFTAVARDESRHVGAGVRILRELIAMDRDCIPAVQELVIEALPLGSQIFQPPGADFTYLSVLGYNPAELFRFGLFSLQKRMRAAGVPMPRLDATRLPLLEGTPVTPDRPLTPVQQMLAPMRGQIQPGMVFQGLPVVFNKDAAGDLDAHYQFDLKGESGGTWTISVHDGTCEILEGPSPRPYDWRLELDVETWISMSVGDILGQEAFLLGRVTLEGDLEKGMRFDQIFAPPPAA